MDDIMIRNSIYKFLLKWIETNKGCKSFPQLYDGIDKFNLNFVEKIQLLTDLEFKYNILFTVEDLHKIKILADIIDLAMCKIDTTYKYKNIFDL